MREERDMSTIVLVHGSFFGAWCWDRVIPRLQAAGHEVHAPALTGIGEREHLASAGVGLELHVQDVLGVLRVRRLTDVVLVGHSYGGMVITGVAAAAPERIRQLIYFDAFVPQPGQSASGVLPWVGEAFSASAQDGLVPPLDLAALGIEAQADVDFVAGRVSAQPLRTHTDPSPGIPEGIATAYVRCAGQDFFLELEQELAAKGWPVRDVEAAHMANVTHPDVVADAFLASLS